MFTYLLFASSLAFNQIIINPKISNRPTNGTDAFDNYLSPWFFMKLNIPLWASVVSRGNAGTRHLSRPKPITGPREREGRRRVWSHFSSDFRPEVIIVSEQSGIIQCKQVNKCHMTDVMLSFQKPRIVNS